MKRKELYEIVVAGILTGLAAFVLAFLGNPANMGFCIACFERDIAGALGLHSADKVQYIRPEIIGLVLGSFLISVLTGEWQASSGSSPALRFLLGGFVMIGALCFLGCPLRMVLRLAGGDGNALLALVGFAAGIFVGTLFLKNGFTFRRNHPAVKAEGGVLPAIMLILLAAFLLAPGFFRSSTEGPGSQHAPFLIALLLAILVGAFAQRSRLCMAGGIRDAMLFGDFHLLWGFAAIFLSLLLANLLTGRFHPGFYGQSISHSRHLWNALGMFLVGWCSVLLGGCPLRQLILAGQGNADSAVTVLGMFAGAAISHNFSLASAADAVLPDGTVAVGGPSTAGKIAVVACILLTLIISLLCSRQEGK